MATSVSPEDARVNFDLAKAIGYDTCDIQRVASVYGKVHYVMVSRDGRWRLFDYRHERTIWRIAERYNAFPWRSDTFLGHPATSIWMADTRRDGVKIATATAPTAALAVALAVIRGSV